MSSFNSYQNPSLAIDLVVFGYRDGKLSILLLNRKEEPFINQWTLPGAFLKMEERLLDTCSRILRSKLGLDTFYLEQLYSFDALDRDPRGRVLSISYFALINPDSYKTTAGTMANDVQWFKTEELPALGFDHTEIVQLAIKRLRAKVLYHPVGFELLEEEFTLPDLHQLYECILGISIDRRNFRRKLLESGFITPTGEKRTGAKNRHPDIYRFNKTISPHQFNLNLS
jgi:8-oxo-dGTP diphosphatase